MIILSISELSLVHSTLPSNILLPLIKTILFFPCQCSGSLTQSVWLTSAPCGVMSPSSSASSPRSSRSTSVWCPGRKTPFPLSQVRKEHPKSSGEHLQGQLAKSPFNMTLPDLFLWLVFDHVRPIWAFVLAVFDQVVENNGKQIIQFHQ